MLYEELQLGAADSRYVMRLEKEQNPITGTKEEFSAWSYNISETWVRGMMAAMYRRFFKDPGTFEPSDETIGGDIVEAAFGSLIGKTEKSKNKSGSYRPKLREDGHPASMSKPRPVFTPEKIDALAPDFSEEYDFLSVFPRKDGDTDYWRVEFPVE